MSRKVFSTKKFQKIKTLTYVSRSNSIFSIFIRVSVISSVVDFLLIFHCLLNIFSSSVCEQIFVCKSIENFVENILKCKIFKISQKTLNLHQTQYVIIKKCLKIDHWQMISRSLIGTLSRSTLMNSYLMQILSVYKS